MSSLRMLSCYWWKSTRAFSAREVTSKKTSEWKIMVMCRIRYGHVCEGSQCKGITIYPGNVMGQS